MPSEPERRPPDRRAVLAATAALPLAGACAAGSATRARAAAGRDEQDEIEALFADLGDQSARYQPISTREKRPRLARLAACLRAEGLDALLIEPSATLRYLCGLRWGHSERLFGLVVLADGSAFWIVPEFEAPRAELRIGADGLAEFPLVTWQEHEYAFAPLAAALRARDVGRIAVEPEARAFVVHGLAAELGAERVLPGTPVVRALRGRKDPRELELMRGASELTQRAIRAVAERVRPGMTDHTLRRWIEAAQTRLGLTDVWVLALVGPGAAFPHGGSEGRVLAPGDGILVDTGGALHGYQSDVTRSWSLGAPREAEFERAWHAVRAAQRAAFERIAPGVRCREVDRAARAAIEAAGYPGGYGVFTHRLGHGIGLQGHEEPYFDGGNELRLEPGMTFSDEPGIYLPGRFGVRLEDIVVVTAAGADHFGNWQESPLAP